MKTYIKDCDFTYTNINVRMFTQYTFNRNNQMTRLTEHMKVRIVSLKSTIPGVSFQKLQQILAAEGMETTKETIRRFWHIQLHRTVS